MHQSTYFIDTSDLRTTLIKERLLRQGAEVYDYEKNFPCPNAVYILSPKTKFRHIDDFNPSATVFGFFPPVENDRKVTFCNVLDDELFACKNAVFTAEGVLSLVIQHTPFSLTEANVLVLGFGRCGKAIASVFDKLCGTMVYPTTATEKEHSCLLGIRCADDLQNTLNGFNVIINTIPAPILDAQKIDLLSPDCHIFDIASNNGVASDYAKSKGGFAEQFLALPGKYCPKSAADALFDCIFNHKDFEELKWKS